MTQGRKTKEARRLEARRRRIEAERRAARARRARFAWAAVAVLAVAGLVFAMTRPEAPSAAQARASRLLAEAKTQAASAGCTPVSDVGPYQPQDLDRSHIGDAVPSMPPLETYPSQPPASGPHAGATLPAGVYTSPPPMDRVIHSLEHGAAVVWYAPDAVGELTELQDFYRDPAVGSRVIVAPYDYPDEGSAGSLQPGVGMALVAWHHVQTCAEVNLAAAFGFTARYASPPFEGERWLGTAPEPGAPI